MTDLVMHQHDSHENVKEIVMTSPHAMPRPIMNTNLKCRCCWKIPSPFSNVHFRKTTKILQHKFFTLKLLFIFTLSLLKVSFPQTMSFSCILVFASSFIHMDLSIVSTSTSLTFPEFLVLFSSISLLFSFIESHFALSSARCHL